MRLIVFMGKFGFVDNKLNIILIVRESYCELLGIL